MLEYEQPTSPATTIARAVSAIRRNRPIIISEGGGYERAAVVLPVEGLGEAGLAHATTLGSASPRLAMTARRAAALGRPGGGEAVAVLLASDRALSAAAVRSIVDPLVGAEVSRRALDEGRLAAPDDVDRMAVILMKLAELLPAAVVVPLAVHERRLEAGCDDIEAFVLRLDDVESYQDHLASALAIVAEARVPLFDCEDCRLVTFRPATGGAEHVAIVLGTPSPDQPVLTRLHSSCLTGDLLGSLRCDCGEQLRGAIRAINEAGGGVLLYLSQEGRSIGLVNKLRAYRLQDRGLDTVDANEHLGFEADERHYRVAAEMLRQLAVTSVRLMTNNPAKMAALERYDVRIVERVPHAFPANVHNLAYLQTKAARTGHLLPTANGAAPVGLDAAGQASRSRVAVLGTARSGNLLLEKGA